MESKPGQSLPKNPRENANPFSFLCFCYTMPIFFKGRKKNLETSDLYEALDEHKAAQLGDKLSKAWDYELEKETQTGKKPKLLRALLRVYGGKVAWFGFLLFLLEFIFKVTQPYYLGKLVAFYSKNSTHNLEEAYLYSAAVILSCALSVLFMHPYMLGCLHLGMKFRLALCSLMYQKALRLGKTALGNTTAGQIVNLFSNDVGRMDLSMIFVNFLWIGPLETIAITAIMYLEIGASAFAGVLFMLVFIPLQGYLGKKTSSLRLKTALRTDERVRLMNEIIQGIQVIKMYAWENSFAKVVSKSREKEINAIRVASYIRGFLLSFIMFVTRVSIFMSLVTYTLLGYFVTAEKAFVITACYNILRPTMTVFFPQAIGQLAETLVSLKRIEKYMLYDEFTIKSKKTIATGSNEYQPKPELLLKVENNEKTISNGTSNNATLSEPGIDISHLYAKWENSSNEYTLNDVSLRVQPGTLVAIIGPVGAGKTSLIQTILGELIPAKGKIDVNGSLSYASQEPWLFSGTVRQNILFGKSMDRKRYREVVQKCALERDFELFPYGDKTIVGERGVSLSGGQKARISLARAVYHTASIYVLDDPLSAVDTHVGRHLFDECMRGYLREKIVVLITHQLQFLQHADQIVILESGKVKAVGTYETLRASGLDFAQLLADPEQDETANLSSTARLLKERQNSETSMRSIEDDIAADDNQKQIDESQNQGSIGLSLYKKYFNAGGGCCIVFIMLASCILAQLLASGGDWFLSFWVSEVSANTTVFSKEYNKNQKFRINLTENIEQDLKQNENSSTNSTSIFRSLYQFVIGKEVGVDYETNLIYIYIFTGITVATIILTLGRSILFFSVAMKASRKLHDAMFKGITRATMYFFNTNPSGRILNRFSKDMGQVDEILPSVMIDVIQIFLQLIGIVIVVAVVNPYTLVPTLIIGIIFYILRVFYLKTSRNVKRIEAVTRSPIYSHLSASLSGLSTIRVFQAESVLMKEFDSLQDAHSSAYYMFISTSRAFGFWLDCFCVIYIAVVTLSFFISEPEDGGNVGLAITQAMGLTGMVQWGMRQSAELENTMTSVERIVEYDKVDPEVDPNSKPLVKVEKEWPQHGRIVFKELSLRYAPDKDSALVLKSLNFEIMPSEKIGIVGRTGAGKSSLINAVFRLSYTEGAIIIDGKDTKSIDLHVLRSKIAIIPQEPVLFSGTMRYNLDPFSEYSDLKLWDALAEVKLKEVVKELPQGLQSKISEGGSNFSVGQRQLVCLARAILRENKILVLDEATANVDPQTDALIQTTIRSKFKFCTVLTIAHRLHTIMDSNKVLVMDAGEAVEFGAPYELLTESETKIFEEMVKKLGKATYDALLKVAKDAYETNQNTSM